LYYRHVLASSKQFAPPDVDEYLSPRLQGFHLVTGYYQPMHQVVALHLIVE
jgi:hypothetical protein